MNNFGLSITQALIKAATEKAEQEGMQNTDSGRVEQVSTLKWLFRIGLFLGIAFGALATFAGREPFIGLFFVLFFGGLTVPCLISYHTCWIAYDEDGFTRSNFFGRKCRYRYQDVTGLGEEASNVVIKLKDGKEILLNYSWKNRDVFVEKIKQSCGEDNLKKLQVHITDFSPSDYKKSYESGVLKKALLVPENWECQQMYRKMKIVHTLLCVVLGICLYLMFAAFQDTIPEELHTRILTAWGISYLCLIAALVLYFRLPDYFTIREKPANGCEKVKNHKLSTQVWAAGAVMFCNLGMMCLLLEDNDILQAYGFCNGNVLPAVIIGFACIGVYALLLYLFKRYSWEYREYKIGFVSFCVWYLLVILTLMAALIVPIVFTS